MNVDNFPILNGNGMAAYLLRLKKRGVYEPHWLPNAAELSYCINGRAIMTIFSPDAGYDSFTIDPGELVFVPRGYIHDIENVSDQEAKFVTTFNYEQPQEIGISGSVGSMPDRVLNATFGETSYPHKFNLEGIPTQVQTPGGTVALENANTFPILNRLACYSLPLKPNGIREPH